MPPNTLSRMSDTEYTLTAAAMFLLRKTYYLHANEMAMDQ